jgi:hypothetical protein
MGLTWQQQHQQQQAQQKQQRQPVIITNGHQVHMTPEQVQHHMMAQQQQQQGYPVQTIYAQAPAQHEGQPPINGGVHPSDTPYGLTRGHPSGVSYPMELGGSPSTDSSQAGVKRGAETSPVDGNNKKPRLVGKRPSEITGTS